MAREFHKNLDKPGWNDVPVSLINGTGAPTIVTIITYLRPMIGGTQERVTYARTAPVGDGAVDEISARMEGVGGNLREEASTCEVNVANLEDAHVGLTKNASVQAYIDWQLGLGPEVACPKSVSASSVAFEGTAAGGTGGEAQIVAFGVSAIEVHDSQGNLTGKNIATGLSHQDIPGSFYQQSDTVTTVSLPSGQGYTVTIFPTGQELVDIQLDRLDESGAGSTRYYLGIPATETTRIRFNGDPYAVDSWVYDLTGNGSQLSVLNPGSVQSSDQPLDTEPPAATHIELQGSRGPQGWYVGPVTVTLSSADASGVSHIEYLLTGDDIVHEYTGPFVIAHAEQAGTFRALAVDVYGNRQAETSNVVLGPGHLYLPALSR